MERDIYLKLLRILSGTRCNSSKAILLIKILKQTGVNTMRIYSN